MCFGQSYLPKSLKARLDTRTAFITLESINDVEVFTSFYNQNLKQSQDINTKISEQYKNSQDAITLPIFDFPSDNSDSNGGSNA